MINKQTAKRLAVVGFCILCVDYVHAHFGVLAGSAVYVYVWGQKCWYRNATYIIWYVNLPGKLSFEHKTKAMDEDRKGQESTAKSEGAVVNPYSLQTLRNAYLMSHGNV